MGFGLEHDVVGALRRTLALCCELMQEAGIAEPLRFAAAVSDGEQLFAFRWSSDLRPPSLYLRQMDDGIAISSEPFTFDNGPWREVPVNSFVQVARSKARTSSFELKCE
jgi:glutamine amidotransferase